MTATRSPRAPLPIDEVLPEIEDAAVVDGAVVVDAPPGAGKTTRVPAALLESDLSARGEIWVLEPRRLPVRLAAARVAAERGEAVGETVGYSVRFEEAGGPGTRLRFLTEGLFLRRLLARPTLPGVAAVILDELHERNLAADLSLAWLRHLRATDRPDLTLVAMSATLEVERVREFLAGDRGRCRAVRSEGRLFEVAIEHLPGPDDRPLARQVAGAVRRLVREEPAGDILVFLPGAADIRQAQAAIAEMPLAGEPLVLPLHGEMSLEEQARAVRPADRRKIVLATNVAESSITIEGVVAVIDSGLARIASHSPWTGLPTLATAKISQAAATQRAGRAGRTRPGRALRLYPRHDFEQRRAQELPEIERADLAELAVALASLGVSDAETLQWLDPPPLTAWGVARDLLRRLGAVDEGGRLTVTGQAMAALPIHPRLARLVVEGERRGVADDARLAAALISERDVRISTRTSFARGPGPEGSRSDRGAEVTDLVDLYRDAEKERFSAPALRRLELERRAVEDVGRVRRQLADASRRARAGGAAATPSADGLRLAILAAFPDRVGALREGERRALVFAAGGAAELGFEPSGRWIVAVDVEQRDVRRAPGGAGRRASIEVRLGSTIEPEWLLDLFPERVEEVDRRAFNPETERVERTTGLRYGALMIEETVAPAPPDDETSRLLAEAVLARGVDRLPGADTLRSLLERLAFARSQAPELPLPDLASGDLGPIVRLACAGRTGIGDLTRPGAELTELVLATLDPEGRRLLERIAPERITLAGGRNLPVRYEPGRPPWIESRLQDFFGTRGVPRIGGGRIPLTVHLLAPNGRAVQVTSDLDSFWREHYPGLRRELGRRYPKHAWPEDGATASPPPPRPRR